MKDIRIKEVTDKIIKTYKTDFLIKIIVDDELTTGTVWVDKDLECICNKMNTFVFNRNDVKFVKALKADTNYSYLNEILDDLTQNKHIDDLTIEGRKSLEITIREMMLEYRNRYKVKFNNMKFYSLLEVNREEYE